MRVATGIAIIVATGTTMAQGQSPEEQTICAQQAKAAFQEYKGVSSVPKRRRMSHPSL
jgi:hypothetical protein